MVVDGIASEDAIRNLYYSPVEDGCSSTGFSRWLPSRVREVSKSRKRKSAHKTPIKRDKLGRVLCRWCAKPVTGKRKTYCSDECVHEWRLRSSPSYMRHCVLKRDDGVCAQCGLDTIVLMHQLAILKRTDKAAYEAWYRDNKVPKTRRSFWDAHHVKAVAEGGGECGLEGMATYCFFCHREATKEQRRNAAK